MKNLVILGASRAGKSTLAREINKVYPNYHVITGDSVRDAFANALPQNEINANGGIGMKKDFPKFLAELLNNQFEYNNHTYHYILETCDVSVQDAVKLFQNENNIIVFLGYAELIESQALEYWRKYDKETDWTVDIDDKELLDHAQRWISKSKKFKEDCKEYNIRYVDTSYNREEILKNLINELIEELKD